jgi:hypothetical protein
MHTRGLAIAAACLKLLVYAALSYKCMRSCRWWGGYWGSWAPLCASGQQIRKLSCEREREREREREGGRKRVADFMADSAMECYKVAKISVQVALCEMRVHNVCVCVVCLCARSCMHYISRFRFACIIYI